jgi:hypothetical protein
MSFRAKTHRNAAIVRAYKAGAEQKDLAEVYGVTQARISQIVRLAGVSRGNRGAGRPSLGIICPKQRYEYAKLRRVLGVEAARKEMGLPL